MTVLMRHPDLGGQPAATTQDAFDAIHAGKGFVLLAEDETRELDIDRMYAATPGIEALLDPIIVAEQTGDEETIRSAYIGLAKPELVELAESRNVDPTGTKETIAARLLDQDGSAL